MRSETRLKKIEAANLKIFRPFATLSEEFEFKFLILSGKYLATGLYLCGVYFSIKINVDEKTTRRVEIYRIFL